MDVISFYHDGYRNLVNYALTNIDTRMLGLEFSMAYTLSAGLILSAAINAGKYVYQRRPNYSVMADNEQHISEKGVLYIDQFPITGLPQLAIYSGLAYRTNGNLFLNVSSSYMGNQWLSFNPIRRTYDAAQNLPSNLDHHLMTNPSAIPNAFLVDFSAGYSCRIKKFTDGHAYYLQFFLGVNNLFNHSIITGGFEQLRFDSKGGDLHKFPNKYYFSSGTLYSLSIKLKI
jgi:outer membrane receptor protein involved in Fe transport